jgi:hypothetical protein
VGRRVVGRGRRVSSSSRVCDASYVQSNRYIDPPFHPSASLLSMQLNSSQGTSPASMEDQPRHPYESHELPLLDQQVLVVSAAPRRIQAKALLWQRLSPMMVASLVTALSFVSKLAPSLIGQDVHGRLALVFSGAQLSQLCPGRHGSVPLLFFRCSQPARHFNHGKRVSSWRKSQNLTQKRFTYTFRFSRRTMDTFLSHG